LCAKCNYHHDGPCAPKCRNCNKISHFARDCRSTANTNSANNQRGTGSGQKSGCHECGIQEHFRRECPKLKNNNNHGNQCGRKNAPARELALLCGRMFSEEYDKIEKYIRGLLDMIHGSVVASKPKTIQEAIKIATELMVKKIRTFT
nr:putative reverse transcriptase domain-containing protein [Tanacetum cinerariifolium]